MTNIHRMWQQELTLYHLRPLDVGDILSHILTQHWSPFSESPVARYFVPSNSVYAWSEIPVSRLETT